MHKVLFRKIINSSSLPSEGLVTFLNPYSYLVVRKDRVIDGFDVVFVDGISMVLLLALFGIKVKRKSFDMTSVAFEFFGNCASSPKRVALIGSTDSDILAFKNSISGNFPGVDFVYARNGFFVTEDDYLKCIFDTVSLNPDVVICGMGAQKQESFLMDLKNHGWNGLGITCGGFIHQTAAKGVSYYPHVLDKLNLRWLYRIFDEPKLIKRYFIYYPLAASLLFVDLLRFRFVSK